MKIIYRVRTGCVITPGEYGGTNDIFQYVFNKEDLDLLLKAIPNINKKRDVTEIVIYE